MPNRMPQYPEYEEALRKQDIVAAHETAHLLDAIVTRRQMQKFVSLLEEEAPDDSVES